MLQGEHSAILLTVIKLPFVIKTFVLSFLSGPFTQVLLYPSTLNKTELINETGMKHSGYNEQKNGIIAILERFFITLFIFL